MALTVPGIKKLKGHAKRREIWDDHGLVLIVQPKPSGAKSFSYRFRNVDAAKTPSRLNIGPFTEIASKVLPPLGQPHTLTEARQHVLELNRRKEAGEDLITSHKAAKRKATTFASEAAAASFLAGARLYIERDRARSVRKGKDKSRGWRASAATLGLHYTGDGTYSGETPDIIPESLVDRWRDRPVASIKRAELSVLLDECTETAIPGREPRRKGPSPSRGREMADVLTPLFSFLERKNWIELNPASNLDVPAPAIARKRVLNSNPKIRNGDEVRWFWEATEQLNSPFKEALRMMLLTGQRRDEVAEAPWTEFSDDLSVWTIPPERTKNGEQHVLPLPKAVTKILEARRRVTNSPFVFSTTGDTPISGWSKTKVALDKAITEIAGGPIDKWRIHDLRRTCRTGMSEIGVQPHIGEAVLNHLTFKAGVTGTYDLAEYDGEKAAALTRWSEHVSRLVSGEAADNVLTMASTK